MKKSCILFFCLLLLLTSAAAASPALPGEKLLMSSSLAESDRPVVSAESSKYDAESGRYTLRGKVRIQIGTRLITTDYAQISRTSDRIWTQGHTRLQDGELLFDGDALYMDLAKDTAWFFGRRCGLDRPGLAIHADTLSYAWDDQLAVFGGHVLYLEDGREKAADHLEYDLEHERIR